MAESSITVAVRIRPFSTKEAAQLAPQDGPLPFLGDGGLGGVASRPQAMPASAAQGLRTRFLRPIIHPVDDKVLIFDPPDNNPLSRLYNNTHANYMSHGHKRAKDIRYAFDRVFDATCGQRQVFEGTTRPLLDGILSGFNASVFAYGATGCGKTHTISGTPEDPGVIFLTMQDLYRRIEEMREEAEINVRLSYLEIYNETIRDLLSDVPTPAGQGLLLREDQANKISVVGISEHTPQSPEHVLEMIQDGNQRRTMSPTEANAVSSRSHAVLQINVTQKPKTGDVMDETTSASLNIIDLAGSERAAATNNNGARMKEGANINKSLLALGNCINALCQSGGLKGRHIPYRNSKLTRLLKFSLGGNCKTVMIVCVSPSSGHYDETSNTLKYANQAKNIRTKVSQNLINVDRHVAKYVQTIHELREEVASLKKQLVEVGGADSAAERKRKREIKDARQAEMTDVISTMKAKVASFKETLASEERFEVEMRVGKAKQCIYRRRISEIEESIKDVAGRDSPGVDDMSDLKSERALIQELLKAIETRMAAAKEGQLHWGNKINLLYGYLSSAPRNSKFDDETSVRVKDIADMLRAELDAARQLKQAHLLNKMVEDEAKQAGLWLTAACRGTTGMKGVAGELEWRSSSEEPWPIVAQHLQQMADHLRGEAMRNDGLFQAHAGAATADSAPVTGKKSTSSSKRRLSTVTPVGGAQPGFAARGKPLAGTTSAVRTRTANSRRVSQIGTSRTSFMSPMKKVGRSSLAPSASTSSSRASTTGASRSSLGSDSSRTTIRATTQRPVHGAVKSISAGRNPRLSSPRSTAKSRQVTLKAPPSKAAGVRFATDIEKEPPPRSQTPEALPILQSSFSASDAASASGGSEWVDTHLSAEELDAPVLKSKPRMSRMAMAAPARTRETQTSFVPPLASVTDDENEDDKPWTRFGNIRNVNLDDMFQSSDDFDDDDVQSRSVLLSKRGGNADVPKLRSASSTSSFAAPTRASMAKSSRNNQADTSSADSSVAAWKSVQAPRSSASLFDLGENSHHLPTGASSSFSLAPSAHRHAPYRMGRRRESGVGPDRRISSGLQSSANTSRRVSAEAAGAIKAMRPRLSPSQADVTLQSSATASGAAHPTSMFSTGKVNGLTLGGPRASAIAVSASSPAASSTINGTKAWGPPSNAAARASRSSRDDFGLNNTQEFTSTITSSSNDSTAAKVRRSVPAVAAMTASSTRA